MNLENWGPSRLSVSNIFLVRVLCGSGRVSFPCTRVWGLQLRKKGLKRNKISHHFHIEFHQIEQHLVHGDMENNPSISRSYVV
jgi:hypothetical protein